MKTLIVITGPTASGKSALATELAQKIGASIVSADSRQIFKGIPIGTAAPSAEDMAAVPHFFVGKLNLDEYYSASMFEQEALEVISKLFEENNYVIMCGGSMMYIDAVVKGLDELPTISKKVRESVGKLYNEYGIAPLLKELSDADPEYFDIVDKKNHKRVLHALEIIKESGKTYSSLRTNSTKKRDFRIIEFAVDISKKELFDRINDRVDKMLSTGWEKEARDIEQMKHLNSLNTVGYKELFAMFSGEMTREQAIEKIKRNTRIYAKKQLTWLKKRKDIYYVRSVPEIIGILDSYKTICS